MKGSKSYKHLALIPLSDIRSLIEMSSFNLNGSSPSLTLSPHPFPIAVTEQFGILCSLDGQIRQLVFRVINTSNSTLSPSTRTNQGDLLDQLAKAISDDRCLLDKVSPIADLVLLESLRHSVVVDSTLEQRSTFVFIANLVGKFGNRFQYEINEQFESPRSRSQTVRSSSNDSR